ncbi:MAG TPA: tripartite tricarboxylate transporter substrate binding protein [Burkholderiales bacterium]
MMTQSIRIACGLFLAAAMSSAFAQSRDPAQSYPARPLRILVGFSAGSTTDILARVVGQKLNEAWGQPVIVDNRPSAGGVVASQYVTAATPDGYTLISVSAGHAVSAALYSKLPYDTEKDFSGISLLATVPSILVVAPNAGIKSVKDLVARARSKPGGYNYSSPGIGSANHLGSELLKSMAGIDVTHVPFKGIPEAITAAGTGTVLFNLSPIVNVLPLAKSGRVLALATTTSKRSAAMPDLPTIAEAGVTGYAFDPWFGLLATGKTPRTVVAKLNREVVRILALPDVKERLLGLGAEATPTTPEQFDAHVHTEIAKFKKIVRDANIRVE